ncbi:MAG: 16S rRNA processing protein RimM [Flavobacteriales bacterium]|nr:16S rRNA processing protein RimM [Flavobacteriales bacterium]MBK7270227.1 16S rRNA processing protein RimM [Flavobacteriales bacterium]
MDRDSLHRLGKLGKPWGHLGDLTLQLQGIEADELNGTGSLFVDIEGQMVPFFYTAIQEKGRTGTLIKFEEIDDPQAASVLVGREIFAPPGHYADASDESWDPDEMIGVVVKDEEHGELGEVIGIEGTDDNPIMVVLHGEHEVLIPLVDEMVLDMDLEQRTMTIRTPEGLIDLNKSAG